MHLCASQLILFPSSGPRRDFARFLRRPYRHSSSRPARPSHPSHASHPAFRRPRHTAQPDFHGYWIQQCPVRWQFVEQQVDFDGLFLRMTTMQCNIFSQQMVIRVDCCRQRKVAKFDCCQIFNQWMVTTLDLFVKPAING